ncbi:MFS transporter [Amycolatopsis cynarae]|uniref:MFS transporter n=1 Tax=Amycolatopsis cynarae TaxID=2995223 RepID=A0ABY7BCU1_9PSEU|nr:MFS transporter [Amycolatopsis sp. HUAS 11-8]WAL69966.1 MFS transporter [Amycolatopsis sp. HUAS 11-8]
MLVMFLARLPLTAMSVTLTMYVVTGLGRGYAAAGLVGTAATLGTALGAPLVGRMIDRYGLRPVVLLCGAVSTAYWLGVPSLPYPALIALALPAGMLVVPVSSLARQVLTAQVPAEQRRSAYSLDTISVESSFMIGPAAAIAACTQLSPTAAVTGLGIGFAALTVALYWFNPPVRRQDEPVPAERPPLGEWLTRDLSATLLVVAGALFCLVGAELATLAALRSSGEVAWAGVVIAVMCLASAAGGMVHGAVRRPLSQTTLMVLLAVLVIPVGLTTQPWWLLALVLVPTNFACAPTLAATAEQVTALAPARVRGEAMGLLDSATRIGMAVGSPIVGTVLDHAPAAWGFAAAGAGGLVVAAAGLALRRFPVPRPGLASPRALR